MTTQDVQITQYIQEWRVANGISASSSSLLSEAQQLKLLSDVSGQMSTLSARPDINAGFSPNARLILYTGELTIGNPKNPSAFSLVRAVSAQSGGQVYYISDTAVGQYLNDSDFKQALRDAIGGNPEQNKQIFERLMGREFDPDTKVRINTRLGPNLQLPFDDAQSTRLVQVAQGDIIFWGPNAQASKVFGASELAAVMGNPKVFSVNGIPKILYQNIYEAALANFGKEIAEAKLFDAISFSSAQSLADSKIVYRIVGGDVVIQSFDIRGALNLQSSSTAGLAEAPLLGESLAAGITPADRAAYLRGARELSVAAEIETRRIAGAADAGAAFKVLGYGGGVLLVAAAIDKAIEIDDALNRGDVSQARRLFVDFSARNATGLAGGALTGGIAAELLAPLNAAGPFGVVAFVFLVGLSALAGGYYSESTTATILQKFGLAPDTVTFRQDESGNQYRVSTFGDGSKFTEYKGNIHDGQIDPATGFPVLITVVAYPRVWEVPNSDGTISTWSTGPNASQYRVWAGQPYQSEVLRSAFIDVGDGITNVIAKVGNAVVNNTQVFYNVDGSPKSRLEIVVTGPNKLTELRGNYVDGVLVPESVKEIEKIDTTEGTRRIETTTTFAAEGQSVVKREFDENQTLISATPVTAKPAPVSVDGQKVTDALNDIASVITSIQTGKPIPALASGFRLLNAATGGSSPVISSATTVLGGLSSLYSLSSAFKNGSDLSKTSATLNAINWTNSSLPSLLSGPGATAFSPALSGFLNGSGTGANGAFAGLNAGAGNIPGVLPVLGLILSIKNGDPIGIVSGIIGIVNPVLLTTPVGWILAGASILRALLSDNTPPEAWGTAKFIFDASGQLKVDVVGVSFGKDRVQRQLDFIKTTLETALQEQQAANPNTPLGVIAQRMPGITWREARQSEIGRAHV